MKQVPSVPYTALPDLTDAERIDLADIAAYLGTLKGAGATVAVVEYYNIARDHYFMSASPAEIPYSRW